MKSPGMKIAELLFLLAVMAAGCNGGKAGNDSVSPSGSSTELAKVDLHQMATGKNFGNILKLYNPVIDEANGKLYVDGSKTTTLGVIDLDTDELVETFDIGVPGGFLIFSSNTLYSFDISANKCYQVDTAQKTATEISATTCAGLAPPRNKSAAWGGYTFTETGYQSFPNGTTGFPPDWRQDLHGAYGVIEIYDSLNVKKGEILHGPDALYFIIDPTTGKLYTTNTGDGSLSIFDLNLLGSTNFCQNNSCKIKDIDVGDSVDEVISDSTGTLYVRNRLGGSVIYKYSPDTQALTVINNLDHDPKGISMWPTGIALRSDEKELFVLSHYAASIDVVDTATNAVTGRIAFTTDLKPRTDSISTMKIDKSRNRLYVAWPELGLIGVADGNSHAVLGTIDLTLYGFDRAAAANQGPGQVVLQVSETNNKFYAYLKSDQRTLIFSGDTLAKEGESTLGIFLVNDGKNVYYVGSRIVDIVTGSDLGSFSKGQSVVAFDNDNDAVYLYEMTMTTGGWKQETIYEFVGGTQTRQWALDKVRTMPSDIAFDFTKHRFSVAYFESGIVKTYSLQ